MLRATLERDSFSIGETSIWDGEPAADAGWDPGSVPVAVIEGRGLLRKSVCGWGTVRHCAGAPSCPVVLGSDSGALGEGGNTFLAGEGEAFELDEAWADMATTRTSGPRRR